MLTGGLQQFFLYWASVCFAALHKLELLNMEGCPVTAACLESISGSHSASSIQSFIIFYLLDFFLTNPCDALIQQLYRVIISLIDMVKHLSHLIACL